MVCRILRNIRVFVLFQEQYNRTTSTLILKDSKSYIAPSVKGITWVREWLIVIIWDKHDPCYYHVYFCTVQIDSTCVKKPELQIICCFRQKSEKILSLMSIATLRQVHTRLFKWSMQIIIDHYTYVITKHLLFVLFCIITWYFGWPRDCLFNFELRRSKHILDHAYRIPTRGQHVTIHGNLMP